MKHDVTMSDIKQIFLLIWM